MKVLKFGAEWCTACKMLTRVLEGVESNIPIEEINIDENQDISIKYGIRGVPTMILVDDSGTEIKRQVGMMTEAQYVTFTSV